MIYQCRRTSGNTSGPHCQVLFTHTHSQLYSLRQAKTIQLALPRSKHFQEHQSFDLVCSLACTVKAIPHPSSAWLCLPLAKPPASEGRQKERQREKEGREGDKRRGEGEGRKEKGERQMGKTSVKESEGESHRCLSQH